MKKDVRKLEHANEILKREKLKVDEETLVLYEDYDKLKETLSVREEVFNTNLSKLESESLLLKKAESDFTANRRWNSSSEALKSLDTHHNQNKKGLGFVTRCTVNPVNKKYVGLQENIICFHFGKTSHYHYTCPLKKNVVERSMIYVK